MKILIILFISILLIGSVSTKLFEVTLFNSKDYEQGIKLIDKNSTNIVTRHIDYKNYVMKDSDGYSYTLSQGTSVSKRILGGYRLETIDGLSCTFDWNEPTELAISNDKINFQQGNLSNIDCNWEMEYLGNDIYLVGEKYYLDIDPSFYTNDTSANNWSAGVFVDTTSDTQNVTLDTTPIDSYTKLLLHMNGTDEGTATSDFSAIGHNVTFEGHANIENSQSKFGGTSAEFDGSGDGLTVADSSTFDIFDGDYTIEAWINVRTLSTDTGIMAQYQDSSNHFIFMIGSVNDRIGTNLRGSGGLSFNMQSPSADITADTWHHVALDQYSGTAKLFVDGVERDSDSSLVAIGDLSAGFQIAKSEGANPKGIDGFVDEVRISNISRYSGSAFTPPTREYGGDFATSGNYTSQVFDAGSASTWETLDWTNTSSTGNNITFQVMSCNDASCSGETWVGPDNSSSTFFLTSPVTLNTSVTPNTQYFRYAAFFETNASLSATSYLQDVNISYSSADANPPTFNESLLNQTVGAGAELNYTVNCTDIEGGVTISDNVTGTETSHYSIFTSATQLFQFRPSYFEFRRSGFHVNVTCDDGVNTISDTFFVNVTEATGESCDLGCMVISSGCTATLGGGCTTISS